MYANDRQGIYTVSRKTKKYKKTKKEAKRNGKGMFNSMIALIPFYKIDSRTSLTPEATLATMSPPCHHRRPACRIARIGTSVVRRFSWPGIRVRRSSHTRLHPRPSGGPRSAARSLGWPVPAQVGVCWTRRHPRCLVGKQAAFWG